MPENHIPGGLVFRRGGLWIRTAWCSKSFGCERVDDGFVRFGELSWKAVETTKKMEKRCTYFKPWEIRTRPCICMLCGYHTPLPNSRLEAIEAWESAHGNHDTLIISYPTVCLMSCV